MATEQRLRVLHVGKFYPPVTGGIERVVQVLCEAEQRTIVSSALVAHTAPRTVHETVGGVALTRVAALTKVGAVAVCPTFPFWMRRLTADIVVIHEPNPLALVAHLIARPKGRLIVWIHAEVLRAEWRYRVFYRPFLRRVLRLADFIVVASPPVAEHAAELQDFRNKCVVIPYAISTEHLSTEIAPLGPVTALKGDPQAPLVLFVGRMVPYKGVDVLIRALCSLPVRAVFVGDGPSRREWEALASRLGIDSQITFAGEVTDTEIVALYNACDIFVLPSVTRAEAFGMVQLEAMACGKPVICTDLASSGVPWVNQHRVTGLVVPPGDVESLRTAIQTLAQDPALRTRMGEAGRTRVHTEFTRTRLEEQTTNLYKRAVGQRGHSHL